MKKASFFIIILSMFLFILSCEKLDKDVKKVSIHFSESSHYAGQDCMSCHKDGSDVEGWFMVAGTVFDATLANPQPNVNVKLFRGANGTGTELENVEVDAYGNFYTTYLVDFEEGLYPAVIGTNGDVQYMKGKAYTGNCNNCHDGNRYQKIWVN